MKSKRIVSYRLSFILMLTLICIFSVSGLSKAASTKKKDPSPITISYDGTSVSYTGVQGKLNYHHKDYVFNTLPIVKLDSVLYAPAEELLKSVFGFTTFSYDEALGSYVAYDEDLNTKLIFKIGEKSFTIERDGKITSCSLSKPAKMIAKGSDAAIPCITITRLIEALGYVGSWNSTDATYSIYRKEYFDWNGEKADTDTKINHVTRSTGNYSMFDNMAYIDLNFYGDRQASFDSVSIDRSGKVITITMKDSTFLPNLKMYDRFGDMVERMVIAEADKKLTITLYCEDVTEFTYTTFDNHLHVKLMWDYSTQTGQEFNHSLKITRPDSSYLIDKLSVYDCYDSVKYTKAFKIVVKGDHTKFYNEHPPVINNDSIKKIKISKSSSGNTVIKITTKKLLGYKIERVGDQYLVKLDTPKKVFKNILIFDCGHGDFDNGTTNYGMHEKNLNLNMGYTLLKKYFAAANPEVKVYWTRMNDSFVTLDDRSKFAKKVGADAFISLHMNAAPNKKANGTEVYYSTNNNKSSFSGIKSSKMASMMDSALVKALKTDDRGVKSAGFYVIKRNTVPAILVELCFLSGDKDHKRVNTSSFKNTASKTIASVIKKMFKQYPTKR